MSTGLLSKERRDLVELRHRHEFRRRYAIFVHECLRDSNGNPPENYQEKFNELRLGNQWCDSNILGPRFYTNSRLIDQRKILEPLHQALVDKGAAVDRGLRDLEACYTTPDHGLNITQTVLKHVDLWREDLKQFKARSQRVFVCSDVHLGTNGAARREFDEFLAACGNGDALILLGDILDCWIDGTTNEENLVEITAQWKRLYARLMSVKKEGVEIHYVPGNHDPFVFTLHSHGHVAWSRDIREASEFIAKLDDAVMTRYPLTNVATIHYPLLQLIIDGKPWLFTHGHVHQKIWHLMGTANDLSGIQNEYSWLHAYWSALASAGAYKFREGLRQIYINAEFGKKPESFLNDVGLLITHEVLHAANESGFLRAQAWEDIGKLADEAFRRYTQENDTALITKVKRGLERLREATLKRDLISVRDDTRQWIQDNRGQDNYSCRFNTREARIVCEPEPVSKFEGFVNFVCGHFHIPEMKRVPSPEGPMCADSGALLVSPETIRTVLQINRENGWIGQPRVFGYEE